MKSVKLIMILLTAFIFSYLATPVMADNNPETRIVGGNTADPGEYPFVVSLQDSMGHFCGASVISPTYVMTAAHCSGGTIDAVIGLHNQNDTGNTQKIRVKRQINHPQYNGAGYDIAVYELSEPIDPSLYSPAKLASSSDTTTGTMTTVIGWGLLDQYDNNLPSRLQEVNVPLVSYSTCDNAYAKEGESIDKNSEICAGYSQGGKDACQGDSGGPLVIKKNGEFLQVGVVSWGIGCAEPDLYGVYAHVANLSDWVKNTVPDLGGGSGGGGGGGSDDCFKSAITFNLATDNYGYETSWTLKNESGNTLDSGSGYNDNSNYTEKFNLAAGNYVFTIKDSYGDGLTEGNGSYKLTDSSGSKIVEGRDFDDKESTNFCISGGDTGGGGGGGDADVITITKAVYRADRSKLTVLATSSKGNNLTLTVVGYGNMQWNATKGAYIYRKKSVANPGNSITVKSSGGGQATKSVKQQ